MVFRVAHWDILGDRQSYVLVCKGNIFSSILMASVVCLYLVCKRKIFLSILMASVICIHFSQLCRPLCNIGMHLITLLNILMPRY